MSIFTATSGPINVKPQIINSRPQTMAQLIDVISDIIDDVQNEYTTQIMEAILASIRFCEHDLFFFNEGQKLLLQTISGVAQYAAKEMVNIRSLILDNATALVKCRFRPVDNSLGKPLYYACFDGSIFLYPTPNKKYNLYGVSAPVKLGDIDNINTPNNWFIYAFDMIKSRACYELYATILDDDRQAQKYLIKFNEERNILKAETSKRNGTSFVKITEF